MSVPPTPPGRSARQKGNPPTIRVLERADLDPVRWIIYRAYAEVLIELYGANAGQQYELRSLPFMDVYLKRDPQGNFVATDKDGAITGAVFCFVWGSVGWFGSLAVAPERQGEGIGQALTARAVEYVQSRGCTRVGLETWPDSDLVRHLYSKLGFKIGRSTVKLTRPPSATSPVSGWQCQWVHAAEDPASRDAVMAVQTVTAALRRASPGEPGADYGREVQVALEARWGDLAVLRDCAGTPRAFALCFSTKPSGVPAAALDARLLAITPGLDDAVVLDALLAECDRRALQLEATSVSCDVNLRHSRAAALLMERGFRPVYELVRMERPLGGFQPMSRSPLLECARWAG